MAEDVDLIEHLIAIENEASEMIAEAQRKADDRLAKARAEADESFKSQFSSFSGDLAEKEVSNRKQIDSDYEHFVGEYTKTLESSKKDTDSFNSLLEKLLFDKQLSV